MNHSSRNIIAISYVVILASLASIYFYLGPNLLQARTDRDTVGAEVQSKQDQLTAINNLKVLLPRLEIVGNQIAQAGLPSGDQQLADLVETVESLMASQSDFKLTGFDLPLAQSTKEGSSSSEIPFSLTVKGKSANLPKFISTLQSSVRPFYVKKFSISTDSSDKAAPPDVVVTNLSVVTYSSSVGQSSAVSGKKNTTGGQQ